ncbi:SDR family oxidoreductase [Aquincola sp. S2]|uniref:SDR family oxidoreductase n=1 Tax=Pseudaquabacterium terrae TaxID=2732868 RepID=A0ABX2EJA2_9BURK|nr:SDR family oxidoreductase [Aquabacterium terrae]NRF68721.1 SDR family oxidoreductase [Aquabacterium terrae]
MVIDQFFPPTLFQGKTVFITGGGSGINLGVARHFAALGAQLAICGRTQDKLDTAARELRELNAHTGGRVLPVVADVRDAAALDAAFERTKAELGPIDVLVCGAAGNFLCPAEALSPNGFRTVIDIDLQGAFQSSRGAFEQLKATRGCLLFISAGQAFVPQAYQLHVAAAKAGIDIMMKNLAVEWGRHGIRANSIVPGPIEGTEGLKRLSNPAFDEVNKKSIPLRAYGTPDDIGQAAVFLASPLARMITGQVIGVDGGSNLVGSALWNEQVESLPLRAKA